MPSTTGAKRVFQRPADNSRVSVPTLETLVERLREALQGHPQVLDAYLFGSRARREVAAHSDVDVAVYLASEKGPDPPFGHAAGIAADLMAALHERRVDVVILNDAPPLLYHRVLKDGVRVLSRNLRETTTREGQALSRYCDYAPQIRTIDSLYDARLGRGDFGR